jgi:hypothetical protein
MLSTKVKIDQSELHIYINLLKRYKLLKTNNYEEIINQLKINFNVDISIEELEEYYSPNLNEILEETRLLHQNLGFYVEDGDYS